MVKTLLCGDIASGQWSEFVIPRLRELQGSAHGPFGLLFCSGVCEFASREEVRDVDTVLRELKMKAYLFGQQSPSTSAALEVLKAQDNLLSLDYSDDEGEKESTETVEPQVDSETAKLEFGLEWSHPTGQAGIISTNHNLTVAFLATKTPSADLLFSPEGVEIQQATSGVGYRGADLFISRTCPKDIHHFLSESDLKTLRSHGLHSIGDKVTAELVQLVRPRYHIVSGQGVFYQRPPYANPPDLVSQTAKSVAMNDVSMLGNIEGIHGLQKTAGGKPLMFTRFATLAQVSSSKEKTQKWLHALNIPPIIFMRSSELSEVPADATNLPYQATDTSRSVWTLESLRGPVAPPSLPPPPQLQVVPPTHTTSKRAADDMDSVSKRFRALEQETTQQQNSMFFGIKSAPVYGHNGENLSGQALNLEPPTPDAKSLFVGGLGRDTDETSLRSIWKGIAKIYRPAGKAFAFVDFETHEDAIRAVEQVARRGCQIRGRSLNVNWSSGQGSSKGGIVKTRKRTMGIRTPPNPDADTLYIHSLPSDLFTSGEIDKNLTQSLSAEMPGLVSVSQLQDSDILTVKFESPAAALAAIQKSPPAQLFNQPLELSWFENGVENFVPSPPTEKCRILYVGNLPAETKTADLQNHFPQCPSICLPEGRGYGFLEFRDHQHAVRAMEKLVNGVSLQGNRLHYGWAKGRAADKNQTSAECWFCLASPSIRLHLIVSVGDANYVALPRGGVVPHHVMVCPIDCVPSRVHMSAPAKVELNRFITSTEAMVASRNEVLLVYERAIRTKATRDHMQVHLVPLSIDIMPSILSSFVELAEKYGLEFHELMENEVVDEVVVSMEGGPYQEYFYFEIPISTTTKRRFVYVQEDNAGESQYFPMLLGSEVAATALGCPERGHWKACLVSEDEEVQLTEQYRTEYAPHDFTLE